MCSGPPPPCSYSTLAHNSCLSPGYIPPPDSRRALEEEEKHAQQQKQSLPSIHKALGNENSARHTDHLISGTPVQQAHAPSRPLASLRGRPGGEGPSKPPNWFSNSSSVSLFQGPGFQQSPLQANVSSSSMNVRDPAKPSFNSLGSSRRSPTQSAKTGIASTSGPQQSSSYDYSTPSASRAAPLNGYGAVSPSFHYSLSPQRILHPIPRPITTPDLTWVLRGNRGSSEEPMCAEELKRELDGGLGILGQPYNDWVKRHLDICDAKTSLNKVAEMNTRTLEFSRRYALRAHQTQRSDPILGSLPSLAEVEDMINNQLRNKDALIRIRIAAIDQEHAMAKQAVQRRAFKPGMQAEDHMALYQVNVKSGGGFARAESKKRKEMAAPRRCHSCNRAETPEWRRGPDGPRTLCNACGLHYAKLTRKMVANNVSSLRKNLKPKSAIDSVSPSSY